MNYRDLPNLSGCYKITSAVDSKVYIGSSNIIRRRAKEHFKALARNGHCNIHLQNAYNKYGEENFTFEIVTLCKPSIRFDIEQSTIDDHILRNVSLYNIHKKVDYNVDNNTKERKPFSGIRRFGKDHPMFGKARSAESRLGTSEGLKKKWQDPEFRKATMEKRKNNPNCNKPMSKETCDRLHAQRIDKCVKVKAINLKTGECIIAESGTELSRLLGISRKVIEVRINVNHKYFTESTTRGGWIIRRLDDECEDERFHDRKKSVFIFRNNKLRVMAKNVLTDEIVYANSATHLAQLIGATKNQTVSRLNDKSRDYTNTPINGIWKISRYDQSLNCPPSI